METLTYDSPLGPLLLVAGAGGLAGVAFAGQRHFRRDPAWPENARHPVLQQARQQLGEYFAGQRRTFELPLDAAPGTPFQRKVWEALCRIPYGSTCSYTELARQIGQPQAQRAVAAANGRNPWSIIVPCHRVIGSSGALTGYAGGMGNKSALLALERAS